MSMPRWTWTLPLFLAACGIPKAEHQKALDDQKATFDGEMAKMQKERDGEYQKRDDRIGALEGEVKRLGGNLSEVSAKADTLQSQVQQKQTELASTKMTLAATSEELERLRKQREQVEKMAQAFKAIALKLKSMVDSGKLQVAVRKGKMTLNLPDAILFPSGSKTLKKEGKEALKEVALVLREVGDRDFLIAGHTDNVPVAKAGAFRSNWELSTARAAEVVKLMIEEGVDPAHLAAAGYGEFDPVADNGTPEGRQRNRRLEIILMPKLDELPVLPDQT